MNGSRTMAQEPAALPRLLVLYGSETGTAQDVAEFVQQLAFNRQLLDTQIAAMDAFPISQLLPRCSTVVFVVSTTGDGEAPENMRGAWRSLLRRNLSVQWLAGVRVAVFGLGDSSYAKYNAVARRLQARLLQLGASELIDRGLGDDQHAYGYFGALNPWLEKLWPAVLELHPLSEGFVVDDSPKPLEPRYSVVSHAANSAESRAVRSFSPRNDSSTFYAPPRTVVGREKGIYMAPVAVNRRLTASDWTQDVRHLEFDITATSASAASPPFDAGDIAVVYPDNVAGVDDLLQYVKLDGDSVFSIKAADGSEQHDLPSPTTLRDLFTKYLAILETPRRSFFEKLSLFATNEEEASTCPTAVSLSLDPAKEQTLVPMWIKKGLFEPPSRDHDMMLIGPGTGLASMRAILQERQFLRAQGDATAHLGATHLYFGCRHEGKDFLYGEELRGLDRKVYVQTRLAENKEAVFEFLMNGEGCCFIAGSAKRMPTDVYEVLRDILRSVGKMPLAAAEKVMKTLVRKKRYVVESWS
ncbi:hypothetical protein BBJ28_00006095 [Nothophytophthora sp. Chile5]|nr:hypothetical protein BBJ28_00006095 [Nothophytophthora sp. Chile5]